MRTPTRDGLVIPPYEIGYTLPTEAQLNSRGTVNVHHGYFYARDYENGETWQHVFRNITQNMFPMLVSEHNDFHDRFDPPIKPRKQTMIDFCDMILEQEGQLVVARRKDIKNPQVILSDQWERIKNGTYQRQR